MTPVRLDNIRMDSIPTEHQCILKLICFRMSVLKFFFQSPVERCSYLRNNATWVTPENS